MHIHLSVFPKPCYSSKESYAFTDKTLVNTQPLFNFFDFLWISNNHSDYIILLLFFKQRIPNILVKLINLPSSDRKHFNVSLTFR